MIKIKEGTMRRLLDDSGWSVNKVSKEADFIKEHFHKKKDMYEMLIGVKKGNLSHRKRCDRLVLEHEGKILLVAVEAEINLGE